MWHLAYVAIGAALVPQVSWSRLAWTILVFALGLGIAAHALDELNSRPLATGFSNRTLIIIAGVALVTGAAVVVAGALMISGWIIVWAAVGLGFAIGYPLERPALLHTDVGFAVAWGGYPVLAGYWMQAGRISLAAVLAALFGISLSLAQRSLSTHARLVRRRVRHTEVRLDQEAWTAGELLATWEVPLRLLTWSVVALAVGMLVARV
jgi:hypothetical protein